MGNFQERHLDMPQPEGPKKTCILVFATQTAFLGINGPRLTSQVAPCCHARDERMQPDSMGCEENSLDKNHPLREAQMWSGIV